MNYPDTEGLQILMERLDKSYYDSIIGLCSIAKKYALRLQELEVQQATSQYVTVCNRLIEEIQHYISTKKEHFVPYVHLLDQKDSGGHDCSNCAGGCNLQHDMQLMDLKRSHMQLKDIVYRVQMVALPLYSETIYPDVYRVLRNNMALIENSLTELYSLEETA